MLDKKDLKNFPALILGANQVELISRSRFGSLREFLSDYENIINCTNQVVQTGERTAGESGYRSESTTYEETVSTTRYSDSGTPEYRCIKHFNIGL